MRRGSVTTLMVAAVIGCSAVPASAEPIEVGHIPKCTELVPAAVAPPTGEEVGLEVRVLLDGVPQAQAQRLLRPGQRAYAPLNIDTRATFQAVSFTGNDAEDLIEQAKELFGGTRPPGTDVVYTLTSKDITLDGDDVAGFADCIGGVAFPDRAFAVGEVIDPDSFDLAAVTVADDLTAKVAAHEIGHLLGGHHHYANCVEGLLSELGAELSPCTLMFNAVDVVSFSFSAVNSLVVRGHAEAYAAD